MSAPRPGNCSVRGSIGLRIAPRISMTPGHVTSYRQHFPRPPPPRPACRGAVAEAYRPCTGVWREPLLIMSSSHPVLHMPPHRCMRCMHAGTCDAGSYPLQKKRHTLEFLRSIAHLRARTNTISAVARVRSALAQATHDFFSSQGFLYVHTPIISTSDCEGAGEMFQARCIQNSSHAPLRQTCMPSVIGHRECWNQLLEPLWYHTKETAHFHVLCCIALQHGSKLERWSVVVVVAATV